MRAWVFPEDKIEPALDRWAAELGAMLPADVEQAKQFVRGFLISDAAAKLRVKECDTPPVVPAVEATGVLDFVQPQLALAPVHA